MESMYMARSMCALMIEECFPLIVLTVRSFDDFPCVSLMIDER